jgi:hypothetical protein
MPVERFSEGRRVTESAQDWWSNSARPTNSPNHRLVEWPKADRRHSAIHSRRPVNLPRCPASHRPFPVIRQQSLASRPPFPGSHLQFRENPLRRRVNRRQVREGCPRHLAIRRQFLENHLPCPATRPLFPVIHPQCQVIRRRCRAIHLQFRAIHPLCRVIRLPFQVIRLPCRANRQRFLEIPWPNFRCSTDSNCSSRIDGLSQMTERAYCSNCLPTSAIDGRQQERYVAHSPAARERVSRPALPMKWKAPQQPSTPPRRSANAFAWDLLKRAV